MVWPSRVNGVLNSGERKRQAMSTSTPTDTVVLVHGLWMTPRSWEHWVPYYEAKGYRVVVPGYPG